MDRPAHYRQLPNGVKCRCIKLWVEADGSSWCCAPKTTGQDEMTKRPSPWDLESYQKLRAMPSSLNDAIRTMDGAADEIDRLYNILEELAVGFEAARDRCTYAAEAQRLDNCAKFCRSHTLPRQPKQEAKVWRCFHCDEVLTDRESAEDHFTLDPILAPACVDPLRGDEKAMNQRAMKYEKLWRRALKERDEALARIPAQPQTSAATEQEISSIVSRLRNFAIWNNRQSHYEPVPLCKEAADLIERIRAVPQRSAATSEAGDPIRWIKDTYLMWLKGDLDPVHMRLGQHFFRDQPQQSSDIVERLRWLCSPDAECLSDYQRINNMVTLGHAAADEIERLREVPEKREDAAADRHLIDFISEKIGLPHNEELSCDNFLAWFVAGEPQKARLFLKISSAIYQLNWAEQSTTDEVVRRHLREIISQLEE